jgi:transcriptional regulator with XRE-family HTH domain
MVANTKAIDTLAGRLRWLRKQSGLTLREVSARSGVSLSFLSDLERGERGVLPSLETLEAIAEE